MSLSDFVPASLSELLQAINKNRKEEMSATVFMIAK
jgi:hypothetical protein